MSPLQHHNFIEEKKQWPSWSYANLAVNEVSGQNDLKPPIRQIPPSADARAILSFSSAQVGALGNLSALESTVSVNNLTGEGRGTGVSS